MWANMRDMTLVFVAFSIFIVATLYGSILLKHRAELNNIQAYIIEHHSR